MTWACVTPFERFDLASQVGSALDLGGGGVESGEPLGGSPDEIAGSDSLVGGRGRRSCRTSPAFPGDGGTAPGAVEADGPVGGSWPAARSLALRLRWRSAGESGMAGGDGSSHGQPGTRETGQSRSWRWIGIRSGNAPLRHGTDCDQAFLMLFPRNLVQLVVPITVRAPARRWNSGSPPGPAQEIRKVGDHTSSGKQSQAAGNGRAPQAWRSPTLVRAPSWPSCVGGTGGERVSGLGEARFGVS